MKMKILSLIILCVIVLSKPKIRTLNQQNMEQFSKDNSYWLIQISSKLLNHIDGKCPECSSH